MPLDQKAIKRIPSVFQSLKGFVSLGRFKRIKFKFLIPNF
jgi:hypothetical protein